MLQIINITLLLTVLQVKQ